jgi:hypothetical protein
MFVQDFLVAIKLLYRPIVGVPTHPFWFRREIQIISIEAPDLAQARFDFCLSSMRSVIAG